MDFISAASCLEYCEKYSVKISTAMLERELTQLETTPADVYERLQHSYEIMKNAVHKAINAPEPSMSGLIGGEGKKIYEHGKTSRSLCGSLVNRALSYAIGVLEVNASMGLIVAAPTAGSCGVVPGTFLAVQEEFALSDRQMLDGLLNAGAVGYLITRNATVAGAEGGCQAEVGAASAMAASALTELMGGSPNQCFHAASIALSNLMGLVCDPIAGLVEAPCQNRNGIGASNAIICAEIALSQIPSIVPFDETVEAMYKVGQSLPKELRETALGGIAATPTACNLCAKVFHK